MALFGRKKKDLLDREDPETRADTVGSTAEAGGADDLVGVDGEQGESEVRPVTLAGEPGVDRPWDRESDGPYDISQWPDLSGRVDLGALRLPAVAGMQMRLDIEQGSNRVVGATVGFGASQAQVQVFAAPRTMGLWDELRAEIARGLVEAGGAAETVEGSLGKELRARMPGRAPDGRVAFQPARFLGIDGPRWFVRVVVNGPAAQDDGLLEPILSFIRMIVVKRGDEPRPPREVLELTAPAGVMEAAAKQAQARREEAAKAAAAQVAQQAPVLRAPSGAAVAGISPRVQGATPSEQAAREPGRHRGDEATDAPKAPSNPEFT